MLLKLVGRLSSRPTQPTKLHCALGLRVPHNIQLDPCHGAADHVILVKLALHHLPLIPQTSTLGHTAHKVHGKLKSNLCVLKREFQWLQMHLRASLTLELLPPHPPNFQSLVLSLINSKASFAAHLSSRATGCLSRL